jgi:hypothetical protein
MFEHREQENLEKEEEPRASERVRPQKVDGLGYDAYWLSGALYVRKGDRILRLAVSGLMSPESKLSKTKALGQKALSRL